MSYISDINNAISQAIAAVKADFKKNGLTMREHDYVAALTTEFPKRISGLIPGVRYGGCFIHQKPIISFTSTIDGSRHSCEIGDLLIICRKNVEGEERYNAALLQFKKANRKSLTIHKRSERAQLEVYEFWPQFTIPNIPGQFDVQPKTVNLGAQYALIYESAGQYHSMYAHIPQTSMSFSSDLTLGRFINDLMDWQDGRTINKESKKDEEEWSRLIWDLVGTLKTVVMNSRADFFDQKPRSSGEFFDLMCNADPFILDPKNVEENADRGISLLFIDDKRQGAMPQEEDNLFE
ncbi:MAG: hypothetical protein MJY89_00180 [Bacteroidales bacterium]|nr:hypothetical protein [Bacteroidales bacterium]